MATEYDQTNRFSIWKNDRKAKDTDPDFTGTLDVDGKKYFVDAWKRREGASDRAPPLSGKVKLKQQQSISQQAEAKIRRPDPISTGPQKQNIVPRDDMNDEIPF